MDWSRSDPIERLLQDQVVIGILHAYKVKTLGDLLEFRDTEYYDNMSDSNFKKIYPLIDQAQLLLEPEGPGFKEAENAPPKTQQRIA